MAAAKWYTDPQIFGERFIKAGCNVDTLSQQTGTPARTLRRYAARWKANQTFDNIGSKTAEAKTPLGDPGVSIANDYATITTLTRASGENVTPEEILTEHGLDPAAWDVISYTSNRWHGPTRDGRQLLEQSKLTARRKPESLVTYAAPRAPGWTPRKRTRKPAPRTNPSLEFLIGDPHCPLEEKDFTAGTFQLLRETQPAKVWLMGDASDNSPWKRHKANRRIDCTPQEAVDGTYDYLAETRAAVPDAEIVLVFGNHDYWVYDRIMEALPQLGSLNVARTVEPVISLRRWLRLDELGIEVQETRGEYHDVTVAIADDLVGMHGNVSGPYGGAVKEFAGWEGASVVQGHDHKGSIVVISKRLANNTEVQRYAISVGTQARRDLGYDPKRNVAQSFASITRHRDGQWHPEQGFFNPQTRCTTWRDFIYNPRG